MASGRVKLPHKQAEHMAVPTSEAISVKTLDSKEPSTHGHIASVRRNDCRWLLLTQAV